MAIQVNGTTVINDSRALNNIASIDSGTATVLTNSGVSAVSLPSAYSVGSYVTGRPNNSTAYDPGATATGVQAIPFTSSNNMQYLFSYSSSLTWQGLGSGITPATMSGTWRAMSRSWGLTSSTYGNYGYKGLWMRIS